MSSGPRDLHVSLVSGLDLADDAVHQVDQAHHKTQAYRDWCAGVEPTDTASSSSLRELEQLRAENDQLREERDALAKLLMWLARNSHLTPSDD